MHVCVCGNVCVCSLLALCVHVILHVCICTCDLVCAYFAMLCMKMFLNLCMFCLLLYVQLICIITSVYAL